MAEAVWPATGWITYEHVKELYDAIDTRCRIIGYDCSLPFWGAHYCEEPTNYAQLKPILGAYCDVIEWLAPFFCRNPWASTFEAYSMGTLAQDAFGASDWRFKAEGAPYISPTMRHSGHADVDISDMKAAIDLLRYPWASITPMSKLPSDETVPGFVKYHRRERGAFKWSEYSWGRMGARTPYWVKSSQAWYDDMPEYSPAPIAPLIDHSDGGYSAVGRQTGVLTVVDHEGLIGGMEPKWAPTVYNSRFFGDGVWLRSGYGSSAAPPARPGLLYTGSTNHANGANFFWGLGGVAIIPRSTNEIRTNPDQHYYQGSWSLATTLSYSAFFWKWAIMGDMIAPDNGAMSFTQANARVVWTTWDLTFTYYPPAELYGYPDNQVGEVPPDPEYPDDPYDPPEPEDPEDPYDPYNWDDDDPYVPGGP